jgi:hypothetical protein
VVLAFTLLASQAFRVAAVTIDGSAVKSMRSAIVEKIGNCMRPVACLKMN